MRHVPGSPSSVRRSGVDEYCGEWQVIPPPSGGNVHKLVLKDNESFEKYGERAGRFGLIEVGAAAQSICLRLAQQNLGGYLLGGVADNEMLHSLGLPRELRVAT